MYLSYIASIYSAYYTYYKNKVLANMHPYYFFYLYITEQKFDHHNCSYSIVIYPYMDEIETHN